LGLIEFGIVMRARVGAQFSQNNNHPNRENVLCVDWLRVVVRLSDV
jgi:hypothetical protein